MPEINVVPSMPPAAGNAASASSGATSADGQAAATPFADVLQQQMAAPAPEAPAAGVSPDLTLLLAAAAGLKPGLPAAATAADAPADPALAALTSSSDAASLTATEAPPAADASAAATDLAAILPMLLGAAGLAQAGRAQAADADTAGKDDAKADDTGNTGPIVALPVTAAVQAAPAEPSATPASPAASTPAAPQAASFSANLAADAGKPAEHGPQQGFETVLAASRDAVAAQMSAASPAQSSQAAPAAARVDTPVGAPGWDHEVGNHVAWMANRQESRAELVLTPPQLGRIEISLSMSGDQANATFVSANPAVREALENALPRLREILADAGVTLGQTQVGAETSRQWANGRENGDNPSHNTTAAFRAETESRPLSAGIASRWIQGGRGMVDVFA